MPEILGLEELVDSCVPTAESVKRVSGYTADERACILEVYGSIEERRARF